MYIPINWCFTSLFIYATYAQLQLKTRKERSRTQDTDRQIGILQMLVQPELARQSRFALDNEKLKDGDEKAETILQYDLNPSLNYERNTKREAPSSDSKYSLTSYRKCNSVCEFCTNHVGLRWASLCYLQCSGGGYAYDACFTVYSIRDTLTNE